MTSLRRRPDLVLGLNKIDLLPAPGLERRRAVTPAVGIGATRFVLGGRRQIIVRNLGAGNTLVLLNGRRMSAHSTRNYRSTTSSRT